ncbi:MAG: NAD(P)H-hydrate dehydratase [Magnetococcales bacterium]|nr:NAD(P)H-hydrate dehydratase [Magnetococcales bacterium]
MAAADRRTIDVLGLPGIVLMENAGAGVVETLRRQMPDLDRHRVVVVAGLGNNGGDGFVVARRLVQSGVAVRTFLLGEKERLRGDALTNHQVFTNLGGRCHQVTGTGDLPALQRALSHAGVVVDALFGTGLQREVSGLFAEVIAAINRCGKPVLAVDLPSGVSADDGRVLGVAVRADWTVTFAAEKIGHRTHPGAALCGAITLIPIGIPESYLEIPEHRVARNLPHDLDIPLRAPDGHKGRFGHLLILAGSRGKTGAAVLATRGALRTGPGLVTLALPEPVLPLVAPVLVEAMTLPLAVADATEELRGDAVSGMVVQAGVQPEAMAMGPGLGTGSGVWSALHALCREFDVPTVLDADALNVLAASPEGVASLTRGRQTPLILTPHPGEMARLTRSSIDDVQRDRLGVATRWATTWGVWIVLKGAGTVIAAPDGDAWINDTGNPGMAAGGSGDLLTGIIGGLLAQGWPVASAVRGGVWLHGAAGDAVAAGQGATGTVASDLLPHIQRLRNEVFKDKWLKNSNYSVHGNESGSRGLATGQVQDRVLVGFGAKP